MRLDKFLKNSRLIKRRTVAKEAADGGRISINNKTAKAGDNVKIGDILEIRFGSNLVRVRTLAVPEVVRKEDGAAMYEVLE